METDARFWPPIVAAVIAAVVAFITARWQVSSKVDELTQTQFKDVIAKRIVVYPLLWEISQTMLSDWGRAGKPGTPGSENSLQSSPCGTLKMAYFFLRTVTQRSERCGNWQLK
jgi:hypothetical protein